MKQTASTRREMHRHAADSGRRQASELYARHDGSIPIGAVMLAAQAFRVGVLRGLQACAIEGDHESTFAALLETWQSAAAVELRRLGRESSEAAQ